MRGGVSESGLSRNGLGGAGVVIPADRACTGSSDFRQLPNRTAKGRQNIAGLPLMNFNPDAILHPRDVICKTRATIRLMETPCFTRQSQSKSRRPE